MPNWDRNNMNNMKTDVYMVRSTLESVIPRALDKFEKNRNDESLSDLYIKTDKENGIIEIYDDMENLLIKESVDAWLENDADADRFAEEFSRMAKPVLNDLDKQSFFSKSFIYKPFSVSLVNEHFILLEELLFLDDENLKLSGESLMDLDKELNDFLKNLLKEN